MVKQFIDHVEVPDGESVRWICPDCVTHKRGPVSEFHNCKNLFINNFGQVLGQCECYSYTHGKREAK